VNLAAGLLIAASWLGLLDCRLPITSALATGGCG